MTIRTSTYRLTESSFAVKSPKSTAFPVVIISTYSISLKQEGSYPPPNTARVGEDPPP